ncbi:MAG: hypothetical protein FJW39_13735 [Acidobacteria bacterium]|nr:hypothetical protein [Acidobacteriota bacterium]
MGLLARLAIAAITVAAASAMDLSSALRLLVQDPADEQSYPALVEALTRDEALDHAVAARALFAAQQGTTLDHLIAGLRLGTKARVAAAWQISRNGRTGDPRLKPALLDALAHPDKHERNFVLLALARTCAPDPVAVKQIIPLLNDPGVQVPPQRNYKYPRAMAAIALGMFAPVAAPALDELKRLASEGDWQVQREAAQWAMRAIAAGQAGTALPLVQDQALVRGLRRLGRFAGERGRAVHESVALAAGYLDSLEQPPTPQQIDAEEKAGRLSAASTRYILALGGIQQGIAPALLAAFAQASSRPAEHVYQTIGERTLRLAMHYPPGWKPGSRHTGIVFFSGAHRVVAGEGGKTPPLASERARQGLKSANRGPGTAHAPFLDALAARGFVCMRAEYRTRGNDGLLPGEDIPDALAAVRWVRDHAAGLGVDPGRVVAQVRHLKG